MDWDTALAWIHAACEVEPSPVLSIPLPPVVVVSEPDQEAIYKPGYAWLEEDCIDVDQTRLGPFTVIVSSNFSFPRVRVELLRFADYSRVG